MDSFSSKNTYSPSADAALIEQVATNDQLPFSIQNVLQLADQFCHNNNCQQEVQLCALTLLRMLKNEWRQLQHEQVETLQRKILMRFGDCQLSKSTRRICGDIIRQLLFLTTLRHWYPELNPTGHDINSLPWPNLFDQLLQVADDESQDTTLRCMSFVVFAENMDTLYKFSRDVKFVSQYQKFFELAIRWLSGSDFGFAIAAAECAWRGFIWSQHDLPLPLVGIFDQSFRILVPLFVQAYRNACDVDEYDAEKQTQFAEHVQSFFNSKNSHKLFDDPKHFQQLCEVFMAICFRNVGENQDIVDVLCVTMLNFTELNSTIHGFIASTPGEITKLFNFFVDLMCNWLEVEYDAGEWPHSFRPLSEDGCDLEEMYGFDRAVDFVYKLSRIFDGKEVANLMTQMLERILDNNENNSNKSSSRASQKVPFNSAASTFQQNHLSLNNKHPQWMVSASILWCFGNANQALFDRLEKKIYSLLSTFVLPAATNHDHPFVRYSALDCVWRLYWRKILPSNDSEEAQSISKQFNEILASKIHDAKDCFRVQEFAGFAIDAVFAEAFDSDSNKDSAENISALQNTSLANLLVQSIFDSLSNHESKPNFVISSHLRALADVCDSTSSDHPLKLNDQLLPLLQDLVQKYHSILLQEIESSSNNNNNNNADDEEESAFSRKARLDPSFKFDVLCLINSIRAATRVFEFLPASEENQIAAMELTSFIVEMLETLHLRVKDEILIHLIYALEFLCTSLGKNNFPNDCGFSDLVDRMMPPLIHYATLNHLIPKKEGVFTEEVSEETVKIKQAAVDIICGLCYERGELIKQKWSSSIGDIIVHLLETEGESLDKMHKMGFDLFVAVGNAIGHPTNMDEAYMLEELTKKNFIGSISNNNNNSDGEHPTNDETSKPDPEEWKFLTKVANRIALRFLGLKKAIDFENGVSTEPGITVVPDWTNRFASNLPKRTPILVACLLPHISPSIWGQLAEIILYRIVRMLRHFDSAIFQPFGSIVINKMQEFDREYNTIMEKAVKLQARRQQQEQRRQQALLLQVRPKESSLESGSRRPRQEDADADDGAESQEQQELREREENQLDDDVLVRQLEQAKQKYLNNGDDESPDDIFRALRKCLKITLAGISAARVTSLWNSSKFSQSLKDLMCSCFGGDLLGLPHDNRSSFFDDYYLFVNRFLAEDSERGRMKNSNDSSNSSHPGSSLSLKTRLELIMPTTPSLDLFLEFSRTTHVPRMMQCVLESDFLNTLFQLSADSQTDPRGMNFFILSSVDSSLTKIIALIQKFKFVRLPEHSGENALELMSNRNTQSSCELHQLLVVVNRFVDFLLRNAPVLYKAKESLRHLALVLRDRQGQNELSDELEGLAERKPKLFIKMYLALQCKATLEAVDGSFEIFHQEIDLDEGKTTISKNTFEFAENRLSLNIRILVEWVLKPVRTFIAEDRENDEEPTDEERKKPLALVDASAAMLLEKLTKCEVLMKQYQKQQIEQSGNRDNNSSSEKDEDAAEKKKNSEPPKLLTSSMIEIIQNIMSGKNETQPTTEN